MPGLGHIMAARYWLAKFMSHFHLYKICTKLFIVKLRLRSGTRSGSLRLSQALSGSLRLLLCDFDSVT